MWVESIKYIRHENVGMSLRLRAHFEIMEARHLSPLNNLVLLTSIHTLVDPYPPNVTT